MLGWVADVRLPGPRWIASAAIAMLSALGCNMLTGAEEIYLRDDDPADGGSGGSSTVTGGGAEGTTTTVHGGGQAGSSVPTGGQGTGASTSTSTAGSGGQGGDPVGPADCPWPAGPYGISEGHTLPQSLSWQGYRAQSGAVETISVTDYFDCDGSKGIHAVLLSSQSWHCGACQLEASAMESAALNWQPQGIKVSVMLLEGPSYTGATTGDAWQWKQQWGLQTVAVVADPGLSLIPMNNQGVPQMTVVDPRTMRVTHIEAGYSGSYPELIALAQQNATP